MKKFFSVIFVILLILSSICFSVSAKKSDDYAKNIADKCNFSASSNPAALNRLYDGSMGISYRTKREGKQYIDIDFCGEQVSGLYIKWDNVPSRFTLIKNMQNGSAQSIDIDKDLFYQQYIALEQGVKSVRF